MQTIFQGSDKGKKLFKLEQDVLELEVDVKSRDVEIQDMRDMLERTRQRRLNCETQLDREAFLKAEKKSYRIYTFKVCLISIIFAKNVHWSTSMHTSFANNGSISGKEKC